MTTKNLFILVSTYDGRKKHTERLFVGRMKSLHGILNKSCNDDGCLVKFDLLTIEKNRFFDKKNTHPCNRFIYCEPTKYHSENVHYFLDTFNLAVINKQVSNSSENCRMQFPPTSSWCLIEFIHPFMNARGREATQFLTEIDVMSVSSDAVVGFSMMNRDNNIPRLIKIFVLVRTVVANQCIYHIQNNVYSKSNCKPILVACFPIEIVIRYTII